MSKASVCAAIVAVALIPTTILADVAEEVVEAIITAFPQVGAGDIAESPVEGLYEVRTGTQVVYVSADGAYLIQGDLFDVESEVNLTEERRSVARLQAIDDIGEANMIVFQPDEYAHTITVFTDIDCGYCRKLHREMDNYFAQGIRVRYLFFPRSGPDTDSWFKADKVWCAEDRNTALTRSKAGAVIDSKDCGTTPVDAHYLLGQRFGIRGTPAIMTESGELIGGYVPADELINYLE